MQVFGVMVVRNEADILQINLAHHLSLGIDRVLIADNGSSDGTDRMLEELARNGRLLWTRAGKAFRQSEITTTLAREAFLRGADWIIPIDADEFWHAPGGDFRSVLERSSAGALEVEVVNFIQRREQREARPEALLEMTRRTPRPVGPIDRIAELVETSEAAFVEILYPPKHISRASFALEVRQGNHSVAGIAGGQEKTADIVCLHAPLRAHSVLIAKADRARPEEELRDQLVLAWQLRRWRRLSEEGTLDDEWEANSYAGEALNVYGTQHSVVFDSRLRDVVAPWVRGAREIEKREIGSGGPELDLGPHLKHGRENRILPLLARMGQIEGWLFEPEAAVLAAATALALSGDVAHTVVEVGSYCGRSTVVLGSVVQYVSPASGVYAIDPHEGEVTMPDGETRLDAPTLDTFRRNIAEAGLDPVVHGIRKRSFEVEWAAPISLLFIDGLHDYANVYRDFAHFERWVVPGGYVVFDDYDGPFLGVTAFVDELLKSDDYRKVLTAGKLIVTQKSNASGGTKSSVLEQARTSEKSDLRGLTERLHRQERGIEFLRDVLSEEAGRRASDVATRDRTIQDLQAEMHAKVAECNRVIQELQAELHRKVGECNRIIEGLQARLQERGMVPSSDGPASVPEGGS